MKIINDYLKKWNLKLVSDEPHTCDKCNLRYGGLRRVMGEDYVYETGFDVDRVSKAGEYEPCGWIVETRWLYKEIWSAWGQHWNYKIYLGEKTALEALVQLRLHDEKEFGKYQYRLVPLYNLPKTEVRRITIEKIINKN